MWQIQKGQKILYMGKIGWVYATGQGGAWSKLEMHV